MLTLRPRDQTPEGTLSPGVAASARVPVVIVTGYLGSGKTSLITSLLRRPDMIGTAVVVNELAPVGVDQSIIADAGAEDVVLLKNGCLCCAAGSDLRNAVARLLQWRGDERSSPRRILIETSGAADPGPILRQVCFDPALRSRVRNGGVLTLFDIVNGREMFARDPVGLRQIGLADQIILTKADIASPHAREAARRFVQSLNPAARLSSEPDAARLFVAAAGRGVAKTEISTWLGEAGPLTGVSAAHESILATWSIQSQKRVEWLRVEPALGAIFERHGDDLLRTKGIVWTEGDERPLVIHGVGRQFHRPVRLSAWSGDPSSRIVIIGFAGATAAAAAIAEALDGGVTLYAAAAAE
jgi:G3E family GTPase